MKLIIDTNIVNASLIKDSFTRKVILHPDLEIYAPEYLIIELENHKAEIYKKSDLQKEDLDKIYDEIFSKLIIVPLDDFKKYLPKANEIIGNIDKYDIPFLALTLSFKNDGIWTNDKDFDKQNEVEVWKTKDLIKILEK